MSDAIVQFCFVKLCQVQSIWCCTLTERRQYAPPSYNRPQDSRHRSHTFPIRNLGRLKNASKIQPQLNRHSTMHATPLLHCTFAPISAARPPSFRVRVATTGSRVLSPRSSPGGGPHPSSSLIVGGTLSGLRAYSGRLLRVLDRVGWTSVDRGADESQS